MDELREELEFPLDKELATKALARILAGDYRVLTNSSRADNSPEFTPFDHLRHFLIEFSSKMDKNLVKEVRNRNTVGIGKFLDEYIGYFNSAIRVVDELPDETRSQINEINRNSVDSIDMESFQELLNNVNLAVDSMDEIEDKLLGFDLWGKFKDLSDSLKEIHDRLRSQYRELVINERVKRIKNEIVKEYAEESLMRAAESDKPRGKSMRSIKEMLGRLGNRKHEGR